MLPVYDRIDLGALEAHDQERRELAPVEAASNVADPLLTLPADLALIAGIDQKRRRVDPNGRANLADDWFNLAAELDLWNVSVRTHALPSILETAS